MSAIGCAAALPPACSEWGFANGLPLVVIELKRPRVPTRAAFDEDLTRYTQQIPALFRFNAPLIASNGTDSDVGSLTADWERFFEVRAGLANGASPQRGVTAEPFVPQKWDCASRQKAHDRPCGQRAAP